MSSYWAIVRTDGGGSYRVTVQANNHYEATQMLRAQYGSKLITECASYIPGSDNDDIL